MTDVIVVIGCPVTLSSHFVEAFRKRVVLTSDLLKNGVSPIVICSGKYAYRLKENPPEKTESEEMAQMLIENGISKDTIFLENESTDTASNAYYVKEILSRNGWKSLILITSKVHSERARFWFEKILGPQYAVEMRTTDDAFTDDMALAHSEEEKIRKYSHLLKDIPSGDHRAIWERLILEGEDRKHADF